MELIRGLHNLRERHKGCVATVGAFDGLHLGHRAVIRQLTQKAKQLNLPSVVIVFEPLPREYFAPIQAPARLTSFRERFELLKTCGVDRVLRIRFDKQFSHMSAEDFIQDVIINRLGIQYIVVGDDLRFGHDREGDYKLLKSYGQQFGFEVVNTSTLEVDGERVSSTRVRQALEAGDFQLTEQLLGRPYAISGKVVIGQQLGRTLNSPTANIQLRRFRTALSGVYAVEVTGLGEQPVPGVANVGTRPTIDDLITAILEVHLLNFSGDIYGKHLSVVFRHKIRNEQKFGSIDELKAAIQADIEYGKKFFGV